MGPPGFEVQHQEGSYGLAMPTYERLLAEPQSIDTL